MKKHLIHFFFVCSFISANSQSKTLDTLIDVGNHKLHFKIVKGKGMPILFDAGGGNNGSVWNSILDKTSNITNATLITYDRAGFGTSTIDTLQTDESKHGIISSIEDLEIGLKKLGYDKEILLVSHSYGGYLSSLYAARHPKLVKGIVLIDVNHNYFEDGVIEKELIKQEKLIPQWKKNNKGTYYMSATILETVKIMSKITIPQSIPVVDFVNGIPFLKTTEDIERWKECHRKFVANNPNVTGITANDCGHAIWIGNPPLVINSIAKLYANASKQKAEILDRALQYSITACNEEKAEVLAFNNSEDDLNTWGYQLLGKNETQKAAEVFKLNMLLNPASANVYDSYGEILLKTNQKEEAIKMYKKSIELNPENKNAKEVLERITKDNSKP
ncbi:alpha/beta fold hydrolase [Flavobacterium sp. ANB]|jgi:tetratricopeptide (TPR) repeat protein|uniref:alpha/beta fold hydrolase n=1 Tax=unclassified Flavobacterium TaxID=196869 RepID=UPI0012B98D6E|nr:MULTISPECIES: alpha/beta fold hydrolase [unclassified Flavobacterium]MBF4518574.1 alpha/beta fold hydrolase [Flavobacterium sp. ANB]MTD67920.1 alpha/beta fold hydrolase [Flavobacterium sp. LC2016-13]